MGRACVKASPWIPVLIESIDNLSLSGYWSGLLIIELVIVQTFIDKVIIFMKEVSILKGRMIQGVEQKSKKKGQSWFNQLAMVFGNTVVLLSFFNLKYLVQLLQIRIYLFICCFYCNPSCYFSYSWSLCYFGCCYYLRFSYFI